MRIGLYGGSFDPIHLGHLRPVRAAADALGLDRVVYLPTGRPPHKEGPRHAPAYRRYAMVEMALLPEPGSHVSSYELDEERPRYTVDTVEHFRAERPGDELVLVIGADSWAELPGWRRWERLLESVEIAVLVRPGWEPGELADARAAAVAAGRVHFVANEPVALSSRGLRARLARGEKLSAREVPRLVLHYIDKYELYRS